MTLCNYSSAEQKAETDLSKNTIQIYKINLIDKYTSGHFICDFRDSISVVQVIDLISVQLAKIEIVTGITNIVPCSPCGYYFRPNAR